MEEAEKKQFTIRIDQNLFEKIEKISKEESRNVNGQIEFIIRNYLKMRGELS